MLFHNFILHQKKGGIHAIYREIIEAFGYFRVAGLLKKISAGGKPGPPDTVRWLFIYSPRKGLLPGFRNKKTTQKSGLFNSSVNNLL
jgi:hypothetical protein